MRRRLSFWSPRQAAARPAAFAAARLWPTCTSTGQSTRSLLARVIASQRRLHPDLGQRRRLRSVAEGSAAALHPASGTRTTHCSVAGFSAWAACSASAARAQRLPPAADGGLLGGAVALLHSKCGSLAAIGCYCAPCLCCADELRVPRNGTRRCRHGRLPATSITFLRCCGPRLILRCSARASGKRCAGHAAQRWAPGVPGCRGQRPDAPGCSPDGRPPGPGGPDYDPPKAPAGQPLAPGSLAHPLTPASLRARAAGPRPPRLGQRQPAQRIDGSSAAPVCSRARAQRCCCGSTWSSRRGGRAPLAHSGFSGCSQRWPISTLSPVSGSGSPAGRPGLRRPCSLLQLLGSVSLSTRCGGLCAGRSACPDSLACSRRVAHGSGGRAGRYCCDSATSSVSACSQVHASGSHGARRRRLPTPAGASGRGLLWQGVDALGKGFSISWFCRMVPALTSSVGPGAEPPAPVGFPCQLRLSSFPMNHQKKGAGSAPQCRLLQQRRRGCFRSRAASGTPCRSGHSCWPWPGRSPRPALSESDFPPPSCWRRLAPAQPTPPLRCRLAMASNVTCQPAAPSPRAWTPSKVAAPLRSSPRLAAAARRPPRRPFFMRGTSATRRNRSVASRSPCVSESSTSSVSRGASPRRVSRSQPPRRCSRRSPCCALTLLAAPAAGGSGQQ